MAVKNSRETWIWNSTSSSYDSIKRKSLWQLIWTLKQKLNLSKIALEKA